MLLISLFLTNEEQGYYFTFGSIIAIQVFFELGLNSIITQYVAHETVHLRWLSPTELTGDPIHLSRLASLLQFCIKVFSVLAIVLFFILQIAGNLFFTKYHASTVQWQFAWQAVAFSTSLILLMNPVLAFLEGLGRVKEMAKVRFIQQIVNIVIIAVVLIGKGGLLALGTASFVSFCVLFGSILFSDNKRILLFIYQKREKWKVDYWKEIYPYQWKIALSWISGYFVFQLFNPVLFATEGPVVAGQMGMTLAALNGISALSMSWINTKVPFFSTLVAQKKYDELDAVFKLTIQQLIFVNVLLISVFIMIVFGLKMLGMSLGERFLGLLPLIFLALTVIVNQAIFSWATYLRCHKQEPFLVNSIVAGFLCAVSTLLLGHLFGLMGIVGGYTVLTIFVGLPWGYLIFKTKKTGWHKA